MFRSLLVGAALLGIGTVSTVDAQTVTTTTTVSCQVTQPAVYSGATFRILVRAAVTTCTVERSPATVPDVTRNYLDDTMRDQAMGPSIPGRGGPRWEGDTEYRRYE